MIFEHESGKLGLGYGAFNSTTGNVSPKCAMQRDCHARQRSLLTHAGGADMSALHDREPAILHPDEWEPYLAGALDRDLAEPMGAGALRLSKEDGFDEAAQGLLI